MHKIRSGLALALAVAAGCAEPHDSPAAISEIVSDLTIAQKLPRYTKIRDSAAARGIANAYLLAGIAHDETGLAMCWSEAQWACPGPTSPDCGGGAVIAGSADGACSAQQGGLGMFQFDAGTYQQTLNRYGIGVLTVDGQVQAAIDYVVHMIEISAYTTNAETDDKARAWLNNFDVGNAGLRDQWIKTVVRYYNGCQPTAGCWASRYRTYSDGLDAAIREPGGLGFWHQPTGPLPAIPPSPALCGAIKPGHGLSLGTSVLSCDSRFRLSMQTDGNLVLYQNPNKPLWSTNEYAGYVAVMQPDGNFVVYDRQSRPLFHTNSFGSNALAVQDDGNMVVYDPARAPLWASNTWRGPAPAGPTACGTLKPGESLSSGQRIESCDGRFYLALQTDGNLVLYQYPRTPMWSTGIYAGAVATMQPDGNFVVYDPDQTPVYASSTFRAGGDLTVQDDGNLVLYDTAHAPIWYTSTFGAPRPPAPAAACGALAVGEALTSGRSLLSCDGRFRLTMQTDGNLVLYYDLLRLPGSALKTPLWSSNTFEGAVAIMQPDGNFVVYDPANRPLWNSATWSPGTTLALQDDANLVAYDPHHAPVWSSFVFLPPAPAKPTAPCGLLAPGEGLRNGEQVQSCDGRFRLTLQTDGNLVLYQGTTALWGTMTYTGAKAEMQTDGNFVVYDAKNLPIWHTATWTAGSSLAIQPDGNTVLYSPSHAPLWHSQTCCH